MKPIRIVLFGITVFLVLAVVSLVFKDIKGEVMGLKIKIPSLFSFFRDTKPQYKDISDIVKLGIQLSDSIVTEISADTVASEMKSEEEIPDKKIHFNTDSLKETYPQIQYPPDQDSLFYPFFNELYTLRKTNKLIRILHYGDSQIEGDRITSYIRNQFQRMFGGKGIGMFPVIASNPAAVPFFYNISGNWKRYSPIPGYPVMSHHRYGALVNFATMLPSNDKSYSGWIELKHAGSVYPLAQRSQYCKIFYGFNKSAVSIVVSKNDKIIDADFLPPSKSLQVYQLDLVSPKDVTISVRSESAPEIYGLALDGDQGVAVDNIPLRGSSGIEFSKSDAGFLKDFYRLTNVKFIIFQFGANTVPYLNSNFESYEKNFYHQLITLKKASNNMPILVVGVGDMSRNGENGLESYPNIEKIRDAQRKAAFEAGCAFWDLYEAMGGKNSMPSWVNANPSLAQKDFVHLNPLGAKIIGEMLCSSLLGEYEAYLSVRQNTPISD